MSRTRAAEKLATHLNLLSVLSCSAWLLQYSMNTSNSDLAAPSSSSLSPCIMMDLGTGITHHGAAVM